MAGKRCASERAPGVGQSGLTLIEMIVVVIILLCISSVALPISVNAVRRGKELQLRRALTQMRNAIDEYHKYAMAGAIQAWDPDWETYPESLEMLVEGVEVTMPNDPTPKEVTFLRAIPIDPMTGEASWGTRSYQDEPGDTTTGGENVYDVYSQSFGIALDGTPFTDW